MNGIMRKMAKLELRYINSFYDRHGKLHHIVRRRGFKKTFELPGHPGSPEFMEAYHNALAQLGAVATDIGAKRTVAGTINALIAAYYKSDAFTEALAAETQRMRRNILERFREDHGDKRSVTMQRHHVSKILEGKKRFAKKNWLKTLKGLMAFAIAEGIRADNPCNGVDLPKGPTWAIRPGSSRKWHSTVSITSKARWRGWLWNCCSTSRRAAMTRMYWDSSTLSSAIATAKRSCAGVRTRHCAPPARC